MKTTLLFVRHGQSIANENGIFAGHLDVPLSELGQKQAVELKDYLLSRYKIDAIYSSDLSRAYATVLPTAEAIKIPIQKDTALREIDGGKWEGMLQKEIAVEYPQVTLFGTIIPAFPGARAASQCRKCKAEV